MLTNANYVNEVSFTYMAQFIESDLKKLKKLMFTWDVYFNAS
jgi:hypothetical protein